MPIEPLEIITITVVKFSTQVAQRQESGKSFDPESLVMKDGRLDLKGFLS